MTSSFIDGMEHRHVQALFDGSGVELTAALCPTVPLDAPGMPPAGPDFLAHVIDLGDDESILATVQKKKQNPVTSRLEALCRYALYSANFSLPVSTKNGTKTVSFLPGHLVKYTGADAIYGPKPARVMVVFRNPGKDEMADKDVLSGPQLEPFFHALHACGIPQTVFNDWYVTTACKFPAPIDTTALPAAWLKDCAWLLAQEIRLVAPDYILCFGAEATKSVLDIRGAVTGLVGRELTLDTYDRDDKPRQIKVMSVISPVTVYKKQELFPDFLSHMQRFKNMIAADINTERVDYADIYTEEDLRDVVDAMMADTDKNANIIAVDCEWHGEYPTEPGAYLRTIQISNRDKWARNIVLRHQGGAEAFKPNLEAARTQLLRLLKSTPDRHVRVGGHFLRADMPWLLDFGVDVRPEYGPAASPDDRDHGGWDTSLMYHAVNETARFGLDVCSMRFTSAPLYWAELDDWLKRHKDTSAGSGYGNVPAHILHKYGCYDADVTRRLMLVFYGTDGTDGLLASDQNQHDCWLPYWTAHSASLAFLEMELTGLVIDRNRADELTTMFMNTQEKLLREIREELGWPDFNPKSQPQLAVALFGEKFLTRFTNPPELPETLRALNLRPIKTTGKRPVLWRDMSWRGINPETAVPSTDKETLGILGYINSTAAKIRDYKFISQVLQSVLRRPNTTDEGDFETDGNDNYVYQKGLVGCTHADGKVRTHFFQTKETGRASSSRPPLQNLSSRREDDYRRIIGEEVYRHPVRSILRVPEGYVGIETDLTGAELAVLAWLSQDQNMIDHVRRNLLPDTHPDHYDIHAQQAVKTFRLTDIEPTAKAMKKAGKKGLRVAAKNVNFGIPYGRGPEALSRQCKEEGHDVSQEECQLMIDAYFDSYPATAPFLQECRERSQEPGWIVGPYGRHRRFIKSKDRATRSEQERQAQNFPIQGAVADAVSIALSNFYNYRLQHPDVDYRIGLQIHDAIVLIVPIEHAERVYKEVIPCCMVQNVPFQPRKLDGALINAGPYYFGSSREVFVHWGELLKADEAERLGLRFLAEELAAE